MGTLKTADKESPITPWVIYWNFYLILHWEVLFGDFDRRRWLNSCKMNERNNERMYSTILMVWSQFKGNLGRYLEESTEKLTLRGFFRSISEWMLSSLRASPTRLFLRTWRTRKGLLASRGSKVRSMKTFCRLAPLTATWNGHREHSQPECTRVWGQQPAVPFHWVWVRSRLTASLFALFYLPLNFSS